ncbi:HNH endonuclease [Bacillus weihaiensis]|uniref:Restriction endonuclease n=1 Tax=Bacillus weihaiensis TaxID=1547283 RepID=A0A1L3MUH9_9BACI|nr:HNH endonuclease [Bacillus weihaiensis]APH05974.1 restriction endonuclease [Bacillus weihaiensis]
MAKKEIGQCELCGREEVETTIHHLTPKEMGGTFMPTAKLCIPCHKQVHALYTNEELASRLSTIEELRTDDKLRSFVKWIRKQPSSKLVSIRKSNERKQKGRK